MSGEIKYQLILSNLRILKITFTQNSSKSVILIETISAVLYYILWKFDLDIRII